MLAKKKQAGGAPEWALTYGDMMSLLLCFFILLAAFADYQEGGGASAASVAEAMQSIQAALGIQTKNSSALATTINFNAMVDQIKKAIQDFETRNRGDSSEKGMQGKSFRLRRIRDGMQITVGGVILFEPFASKVTAEGAESLESIARVLRGHRNKLEIVGHAAEQPRPADWTHTDAMRLSYDRAMFVADELVKRGVDPRTVRVVAVGANEPVSADGIRSSGENRRVEIIVRESMIDDYRAEQPARQSEQAPSTTTRPSPQNIAG